MPSIPPTSLDGIQNFLIECGATTIAHGNNRCLYEHLRGTMKILSGWRQPRELVVAGLLHSIYATDVYPHRLIPLSERKQVAIIAGVAAERLAYLFCSIRREDLFDKLARRDATDWATIPVDCHQRVRRVNLSREDVGNLLIIYMANAAEQTGKSNGEPGLWVAATSRWGKWVRPLARNPPPVFDSCSIHVSVRDEKEARRCYLAGLQKLSESPASALRELLTATALLSSVAEPHALLAYAALREGRWCDAYRSAGASVRRLGEWGTAWDKRLEFEEWRSLLNGIIKCAEIGFVEPNKAARLLESSAGNSPRRWEDELRHFTNTSLAPIMKASPGAKLPPRFLAYLASFARTDAASKHNFYPGLRKRPAYPASQFELAKALSASYLGIKAEFRSLRRGDGFQAEIEKIGRTGTWRIFPFYELGRRNNANCQKCPVTTSVLERNSAVDSVTCAAYFSILAPRTHVAAHKGPTNMRLRCHLGIEVPKDCWLRVGDQIMTWREGECLIFDDSYVHEVWNDSDKRRVVLVIDIWHPDLTAGELDLVEGLQRYAYAHAAAMSRYWRNNERARVQFTRQPAREEIKTRVT